MIEARPVGGVTKTKNFWLLKGFCYVNCGREGQGTENEGPDQTKPIMRTKPNMLSLVRIHHRAVPVLRLWGYLLTGGDMLRMRAIYIHRHALDHQGFPCLGRQVFRLILSCEEGRCNRIYFAFGGQGRSFPIPTVTWRFAYRWRSIGGLQLYKLWNALTWRILNPDRYNEFHGPRWEVLS